MHSSPADPSLAQRAGSFWLLHAASFLPTAFESWPRSHDWKGSLGIFPCGRWGGGWEGPPPPPPQSWWKGWRWQASIFLEFGLSWQGPLEGGREGGQTAYLISRIPPGNLKDFTGFAGRIQGRNQEDHAGPGCHRVEYQVSRTVVQRWPVLWGRLA